MNKYMKDGLYAIGRASGKISDEMSDSELEDAVIQFAFGIERICKGILISVNPVFILENYKYSDSVAEIYRDKLTSIGQKELDSGKRNKVIAMQESIIKASHFSDAISNNKDILQNLRSHRDVLAHRTLDELQHQKVREWLLGVYHTTISAIIDELNLDANEAFSGKDNILKNYSDTAKHQESLAKTVSTLLASHLELYKNINGEAKAEATRITQFELNVRRAMYNNSYERFTCPSCGNDAVLEVEVEIEGDQHDWYFTGPYPINLNCQFCGLSVNDFEQLNYLNAQDFWAINNQKKT